MFEVRTTSRSSVQDHPPVLREADSSDKGGFLDFILSIFAFIASLFSCGSAKTMDDLKEKDVSREAPPVAVKVTATVQGRTNAAAPPKNPNQAQLDARAAAKKAAKKRVKTPSPDGSPPQARTAEPAKKQRTEAEVQAESQAQAKAKAQAALKEQTWKDAREFIKLVIDTFTQCSEQKVPVTSVELSVIKEVIKMLIKFNKILNDPELTQTIEKMKGTYKEMVQIHAAKKTAKPAVKPKIATYRESELKEYQTRLAELRAIAPSPKSNDEFGKFKEKVAAAALKDPRTLFTNNDVTVDMITPDNITRLYRLAALNVFPDKQPHELREVRKAEADAMVHLIAAARDAIKTLKLIDPK